MIKTSDCNQCTRSCDRKTYDKVDHFQCPKYLPYKASGTPILRQLISDERKVQGLFDCLNLVGLTLVETTGRLGFRLEGAVR